MDYDTAPDPEIDDIELSEIPAKIEELRKEMFKAAEDLDFETAADLRDQLLALEQKQLRG